MAMKLYDRIELPEDFPTIRSVRYGEAHGGRAALETLPVIWAEETDRGRRYLHVKAGFDRGFRGDLDLTLIASDAEAPPDLTDRETCLGYARQVGEWLEKHRKAVVGEAFYDGAAGVALFAFDLHRATGEARWKKLGDEFLDRARKAERDDAGLYTGLAGLGQVLIDASRATDDPKLLAEARAVGKRLPAPRATDIISGAAGTGIFLLNLHAETGEKEWLEKAVALGDYLEKLAVREEGRTHWAVAAGSDRVYLGFSHGAAGIGYFLLHLGLAAEDEKYVTLAEEAAAFVGANGTALGSGLAFTKMVPPRKKAYPVQWCHGSPGIALFFDAMHAALGGREYERVRDECVRADVSEGRTARAGGCQCHGVAGNAETLITVYRTTGDAALLGVARRFAEDLVGGGEVKTAVGSRHYGPGYMTGLAGIGRFFLRLADPDGFALPLMVERRLTRKRSAPVERTDDPKTGDPVLEKAGRLNELALQDWPRASEQARSLGAEGFRALCRLIEKGEGHWKTHELLRVTWYPGGEEILLRLADGPALPRHGLWTVLKGLGTTDTPAVRKYLVARIAKERDAGLFMSTAQALALLEEERGAKHVAKQLLAFEDGWGGVEPHLVRSLGEMGGKAAVPDLVRFATDDRATRDGGLLSAIALLDRLAPKEARKAARAIRKSGRYESLGPATRARIDGLVD